MSRDRGLRGAALLATLVLGGACSRPAGPDDSGVAAGELARLGAPGRGAGMHLLLITVDTLRADRLGCYGYAAAETPHIDALARDGLRFDQASSAVPITLPSHATILTGLDPPSHGVRHNGTFRLGAEHPTLAQRLAAAGYDTAAFVGAFVLDRRYGLDRGFAHYDDAVNPAGEAAEAGGFNERPANRVVDAAIEWLDRRPAEVRRPFFVWAHFFDPHGPYRPPGEFAERFAGRPYDGEIAFTDSEIGRLLDFLRARGELERTVVLFVSDHGEGLGEHDEATHADLIYDSTMRVPLILSNPRLFGGGGVVRDRVAGTVDVLPTVLDLLGVDRAGLRLDGRNVMTGPAEPERALYIETLAPLLDYGWAPLRGLRRARDKLIRAPTPEFYDLVVDPDERRNVYATDDAVVLLERRLDERLRRWPTDADVLGGERRLDADELERLASLGYVRGARPEGEVGVKDPKRMMAVWARMNRAGQLSVRGEHEDAIAEIRGVLGADPRSGKAWYTAMRIYDAAGRVDEAEAAARRAVGLSPRAEGYLNLARYALNRDDVPAFEAALAEAERLDPGSGGVHIGRGHFFAMRGRLEEARREFETAIAVDPVRSAPVARDLLRKLDAARGAER